jgi:hypothetical protein
VAAVPLKKRIKMNTWISKSGHDFCSPSKLSLRAACPGSARYERDFERSNFLLPETSKAASRGQKLHSLTVGHLESKLDTEAFNALSDEDKQQVIWSVDRTKEIIDRFKEEKPIIIYEDQVDLSELGISGGIHGSRVDALILVPGYGAVVIDWKFGRMWVTNPEYNLQTKAYAWGIHHNYGGNVETIILQPQCPEGRDYMSYFIVDDQFNEIGKQIRTIVENAKKPDAPLVRGAHCEDLFCFLRGSICPLWNKSLLEIPDKSSVASYFETLSPADRKSFYDHIKTIIHVAEHCDRTIKQLCIEGGLEINGYKVTYGKPSFVCNDPEKVINKLLPFAIEKGLSKEDLLTPAVPPQAKSKSDYLKLLGNKKVIRDILEEEYAKVIGNKTLKRIKE